MKLAITCGNCTTVDGSHQKSTIWVLQTSFALVHFVSQLSLASGRATIIANLISNDYHTTTVTCTVFSTHESSTSENCSPSKLKSISDCPMIGHKASNGVVTMNDYSQKRHTSEKMQNPDDLAALLHDNVLIA